MLLKKENENLFALYFSTENDSFLFYIRLTYEIFLYSRIFLHGMVLK
jgi:hypothetical protein